MKKISVVLVIFLFALASYAMAEKAVRIPFQAPPSGMQLVPDEFVVKFHSDAGKVSPRIVKGVAQTGIPGIDALNRSFDVDRMAAQFPGSKAKAGLPDLSGYHVVRFNGPQSLQQVMDAYAKSPFVDHVEPIGIHPVYGTPDDPYYDDPPVSFPYYQWHFEQGSADHDVDAAAAWDLETGDATVLIGIIDSGVRYFHKDLGGYLAPDDVTQGNIWINYGEYGGGKESNGQDDDLNGYVDDWVGWDWVDGVRPCAKGEDCGTPDNDPRDFNGHGTHVAGIVGAITNNGYCGAGMAGGWNSGSSSPANGVKVMALRAGWEDRAGNGYVRMDFCAQAMYYATNAGATAVNCSWGSSATGGFPDAVDYAIGQGVLIVAGAGNANNELADYLGARTDVMDVAATDSFDVKAYFSTYGTWVDVSAPGEDILSTLHVSDDPDYDYIGLISGTSQACPHVVGLAALLKSYEPTLSSSEIWNYIVDYADPIDDLNPGYEGKLGSGRINAYSSLNAVGPPPPDSIPPADVTDLAAATGTAEGTVDLTWTAPGDDGSTGNADTYDVRYQLASLGPLDTETEFNVASQATGEPSPGSAGSTENFTVTGLTPNTAYYFALKTADEVPNWSGFSNTDSATAAEAPPETPMYVESIAMSLKTAGPNVNAIAAPHVVEDMIGTPNLEGVTVYGHWYGQTSDVDQCITGPDGTCEVTSDKIRNPSQDFCFQVDSLVKTNYYWDDTKGVTYNCISPTSGRFAKTAPVAFAISENYPDPFNPVTQFTLDLLEQTHVSFHIYNVAGQKVKTLANEIMSAGSHTLVWDGTNESGQSLSSGVYFYRVAAGNEVVTEQMTLLK